MRAISIFSREAGTSAFGCRARIALRTLVSMSAVGSLSIFLISYQLALITPGISPFKASCRKHSRHTPNLRRKPRGRPQRQQRFRCLHHSFGFFVLTAASSFRSLAILAVVAIVYFLSLLPEWHSHVPQQRQALGIRFGRGGNGNVHALRLLHFGVIDFGEDQLIFYPQRVIAAPVERFRRDPAEVAHPRQRHVHQAVEKLVHAVPTQRHHAGDGHVLAQLESRDRFARLRHHRLLSGNLSEFVHRAIHQLGVLGGLAQTDIDGNLLHLRHRHGVLIRELLGQRRDHFLLIMLSQSGWHRFLLLHYRSVSSAASNTGSPPDF